MTTDGGKLVGPGDEVACADWVIILCYVKGALLQVRTIGRIDETRRSGNRGRWRNELLEAGGPGPILIHIEKLSSTDMGSRAPLLRST